MSPKEKNVNESGQVDIAGVLVNALWNPYETVVSSARQLVEMVPLQEQQREQRMKWWNLHDACTQAAKSHQLSYFRLVEDNMRSIVRG